MNLFLNLDGGMIWIFKNPLEHILSLLSLLLQREVKYTFDNSLIS